MKYKATAIGLVLLVILGLFYWKKYMDNTNNVMLSPVLKEGEKEKIVVNTRNGTVTRSTRDNKGNQATKVTPGVRQVAVTIDDNNKLSVYFPTKGFVFEPGLSTFVSGGRANIGLDAQLFYYKQYGVLVGLGTDYASHSHFRVYVAGSYSPPIEMLSNTSLFLGIDHERQLTVGVRVRL